MAKLVFPINLARKIECPTAEFPATTVAALFESYFKRFPGVRHYVLDDQGAVRHHVVVLVDGLRLQDRSALSDGVGPDSEVCVFQALSGG